MVDIYVNYEGELHCKAIHGPSSATLITDAPVDNHGKGATFSPTDLLATSLGTCMATTMGILARSRGYGIEGMTVHVKKIMTTQAPRRIDELVSAVRLPPSVAGHIDADGRTALENAALTCPVRLSLLEAIQVPVSFDWQSA